MQQHGILYNCKRGGGKSAKRRQRKAASGVTSSSSDLRRTKEAATSMAISLAFRTTDTTSLARILHCARSTENGERRGGVALSSAKQKKTKRKTKQFRRIEHAVNFNYGGRTSPAELKAERLDSDDGPQRGERRDGVVRRTLRSSEEYRWRVWA